MSYAIPSSPEVIGPGIWIAGQYMAKLATTQRKIDYFIEWVNEIAIRFPCKKCRIHFLNYIKKNPPELMRDTRNSAGILIGMFKWWSLFHNTANARLGKPQMDWETAIHLYFDEAIDVCDLDCDDDIEVSMI